MAKGQVRVHPGWGFPSPTEAVKRSLLSWLWCALLLGACQAAPVDARPETVVQAFVESMRRVHGEPGTARAAFDLLWLEAQGNLADRAKRATAVTGKPMGPEEMLTPSHFFLNFRPKHYHARIEGDWAVVTITGEVVGTQKAEVKCVLEPAGWRVALELPPLMPIRKRPDEGS